MMRGTRDRRREGGKRPAGHAVAAAILSAAVTALLLPLSSGAQSQAAPVNTSPPTITGTPAKGQTLVAGTGTWTGSAPISFAFSWGRCDSAGANCVGIAGATGTTHVLGESDVGTRLRVVVQATNAEGSASAQSDATATVSGGGPTLTTEPHISGTPAVGQKLSATGGSWAGATPMTFAYQWVRCGADGGNPDGGNCTSIAGATATTYVLATADAGFRLRFRVTATNAAGSQTVASNPTATVSGGKLANTKAPTISGSMVEGQTVKVSPGTWSGGPVVGYGYQWLRCNTAGGSCAAIGGATGSQYKLTSADAGHKIRVNVTARSSDGSTATAISGESAVVAASGPAGVIVLPTGEKSIPASSVPRGERLVVDRVRFAPSIVQSRRAPISVEVRVKDTRGYVVRNAMVFIRSTPLVTRAGSERRPTVATGAVVFQMTPRTNFPTVRRGAVQFFVKAYRTGDNPLAGIAGYRLVQVRIAR